MTKFLEKIYLRLKSFGFYNLRIFLLKFKKTKYIVCVIANGNIPTYQLSILAPFTKNKDSNVAVYLITEPIVFKNQSKPDWFKHNLKKNNTTHVIFCRYSGIDYQMLSDTCKSLAVPTLYCIDDDLLNVPEELGAKKYKFHNSPERLKAVRFLLNSVDIPYTSNEKLAQRLKANGITRPITSLHLFCAGEVFTSPTRNNSIKKIGYMGFDHEHDLKIVLPSLVLLLHKYPSITFDLFGKIPKPKELDQFGNRVQTYSVETDYFNFLSKLVSLKWDIGICPLANTSFNSVKNINKWVEYTSAGISVVGSKGLIYDECCDDECGTLVGDDEWYKALSTLIENPSIAYQQCVNAQEKLRNKYSLNKLYDELSDLLIKAEEIVKS